MNNNSLRFRIILIVVTPIFDAHLVFFKKPSEEASMTELYSKKIHHGFLAGV